MQMLWCWRCRMEVPMLDEEESARAYELYGAGFHPTNEGSTMGERWIKLVKYYEEVTGWPDEYPNAIIHHLVHIYGPPCKQCGKPYRTPQARLCAACGHKRPFTKRALVISFDLDDTLIPGAYPFGTEPQNWWQRLMGIEKLRKGTPALMKALQADGHTVCIYTTSLRPVGRIRRMLSAYGINVGQIINRQTHIRRVSREKQNASKYPPAFGIDIHIDDSAGVEIEGKQYGFVSIIVPPKHHRWEYFVRTEIERRAILFD